MDGCNEISSGLRYGSSTIELDGNGFQTQAGCGGDEELADTIRSVMAVGVADVALVQQRLELTRGGVTLILRPA